MTFVNKVLTTEIVIMFLFWFWLFAGMGLDGVATSFGFWVSTAFMVFVNRTIEHGFKP